MVTKLKKSGTSQVRSRKAKGRLGQNEIRDRFLKEFDFLEPHDVRCALMGETGEDLKWSPKAFAKLPLSVEVKRRKSFKTLYDYLDQANNKRGNPVVFMRGDRKPWLVLLDIDYFIELLKRDKNT